MAKTRMLKHDLRTSEKVAFWPIPLRYFWVLLWGYVDDHGKGKDNPQLIKADCFPLDDEITADQLDVWLDRFMLDGVVARYTVDGTRYLKVVNWKEHQKPPHPSPDKIPGPEHPQAVSRMMHESLLHDAGTTPATFTNGLGMGWVEYGLSGGDADAAKTTPPVDNSEPPLKCPTHLTDPNPPKCGQCKDARLAHDAWATAQGATVHPIRKPVKHIPGLCDAHRQPEATCDMCDYERKHA